MTKRDLPDCVVCGQRSYGGIFIDASTNWGTVRICETCLRAVKRGGPPWYKIEECDMAE